MKEVTAYRSIDGKLFDSKSECVTHDLAINRKKDLENLKKKLNDYGTEFFENSNEVLEFLKFLEMELHLLGYTLTSFLNTKGSKDVE